MYKIVGVDLAGVESRPSGLSIMNAHKVSLKVFKTDRELLKVIELARPLLVSIDAPLSLPLKGFWRDVDKLMLKRGLRVLPPGIPGMLKLTRRAVKLKRMIDSLGVDVIEVHPTSSLRVLGIPREKFLVFLRKRGFVVEGTVNNHTIDAAVAAYTGLLYLTGRVERVQGKEGEIIIPKKRL
ncbi:MAG: hypothetical protein DRJ47_01045 [Thermoprotei archaeon]|nr:MAG: hypothetical protein DRJ47_01045 [Thermoprotei archaeon]